MTHKETIECHVLRAATRLSKVEYLRDALPQAARVLERMADVLPHSLLDEVRVRDERLIQEAEAVRDELAALDPASLEGAVAQLCAAERDWLSGDPELRGRAVLLAERAARYLIAGRQIEGHRATQH